MLRLLLLLGVRTPLQWLQLQKTIQSCNSHEHECCKAHSLKEPSHPNTTLSSILRRLGLVCLLKVKSEASHVPKMKLQAEISSK